MVREHGAPRVADPPAVDEDAQLPAAAGAVAADAARVETDAPLVEELAEREAVLPVRLDVDQPTGAVRVQRRVHDLTEELLARRAVTARPESGRARPSIDGLRHADAAGDHDLAPVDDHVEVQVVVTDHRAEQRRQVRIADPAERVCRQPPRRGGRPRQRRRRRRRDERARIDHVRA